MGWSIGYDPNWKRDIGYGVPATCDHPGCGEKIDRGLSYVCGGHVYGGEDGCGLFFCERHLYLGARSFVCERCLTDPEAELAGPFEPTPDVPEWIAWKLTDESWERWRQENPAEVDRMRATGSDAGSLK